MSTAKVPMHFAGIGRRPEPVGVSAQVARNLGLSSHTAVTSPRGDANAAWETMMDALSDLSGDDQADFAMAAPGDLLKQSADALSALGTDFEPEELAAALLPALCALGRCHYAGADDDDDAAAQGTTPAERRRAGTEKERINLEQEEMRARCIVEGHSGHVVSHIRR